MVIDSFLHNIKTNFSYKDIAGDIEATFDSIGYAKEDASSLLVRRNKKIMSYERQA